MSEEIPVEVGVESVRRARRAVELALGPPSETPASKRLADAFEEPRGVFVTLHEPDGALRGCIGFPRPYHPLGRALADVAVSAALEDPRFPPVTVDELPRLLFEVSILTRPERVPGRSPGERAAAITIGRDGLIVEGHGTGGLLLPQVAVEQGWGPKEFLAETCLKAGLRPEAWLDPAVTVLRFSARIFRERRPGGEVVEVPLSSDATERGA